MTLLFFTGIVAFDVALARLGLFAAYLASIVTVSMLVTYYSRFALQKPQFLAAVWGVSVAMGWAGGAYAAASFYSTTSMLAAFLALLLGGGFGFVIALLPASAFSLVPEPKVHYYGERNPKKNYTVASILRYIHGSGG